jgi:hypothetical protein
VLHHVRQLVRQQLLTRGHTNRRRPTRENNMPTDRVRPCLYCIRGRTRGGINMHPHIAEVTPEPRLHERTHRRI